ncbi:MAG: hypothetical protein ACLFWF_05305 [Alphaproteobacteria bacterium]
MELEINGSKVLDGVLGNGQADIDAAAIFIPVVSNVFGHFLRTFDPRTVKKDPEPRAGAVDVTALQRVGRGRFIIVFKKRRKAARVGTVDPRLTR